MPGQVIIKKYSNRRLYDTTNKRYVTLDEIANLIREGNEIKVLDSQSDEDITKVILIQVVLESEKNKVDILPTSFLHMLIKYGNKVARDFFENYFLMMFQPYLSFQENMKKNLRWWQDIGWLPGDKRSFPSPFNYPLDSFSSEQQNQHDGETMTDAEEPRFKPHEIMEMEILRRRVRELEDKVRSMDKPKKGKVSEKETRQD